MLDPIYVLVKTILISMILGAIVITWHIYTKVEHDEGPDTQTSILFCGMAILETCVGTFLLYITR